jgi:hypothetical protein
MADLDRKMQAFRLALQALDAALRTTQARVREDMDAAAGGRQGTLAWCEAIEDGLARGGNAIAKVLQWGQALAPQARRTDKRRARRGDVRDGC